MNRKITCCLVLLSFLLVPLGTASAQNSQPWENVSASSQISGLLSNELVNGLAADAVLPPKSSLPILAATGFTSVTAGEIHTCAITGRGAVKCWGSNDYGQLGDGTSENRYAPVYVSGLSSGVLKIAAGELHTCALTSGGGVKCWGTGLSGELGDGTRTYSQTIPVDVVGLSSGVVAIAAGAAHTCALTSGGAVKCWGNNTWGQLGDGTPNYTGNFRTTPVEVYGLSSGITAIAGGVRHTCAVTSDGKVKCWGNNEVGQLGNGTLNASTIPVDVVDLPDHVVAITTGGIHTCALTSGGAVKCWGDNQAGQLGDGTEFFSPTPINVVGLSSGIMDIAAGYWHTCAVTSIGAAKCWGANDQGQLGDSTRHHRKTPVEVVGLSKDVIGIATGRIHTCAVTSGGAIKCWGWNYSGQLGDGTIQNYTTPRIVPGLTADVLAIAAGNGHTCAVAGGAVKCWGDNFYGQLGDGSLSDRMTPVGVVGLSSGVTHVATQLSHTCALTSGGAVKCWGENDNGQLGDGSLTDRLTPVAVVGLSHGVIAIATGGYHTCALTIGGGVKCWGNNAEGQLGNGTLINSAAPVSVSGLASGVRSITAGTSHTCAMTSTGNVKCWGSNYAQQIGDGTRTNRASPVDVLGLPNGVSNLAAGLNLSCAVTSDGGVYCWGNNPLPPPPPIGGITLETVPVNAPQQLMIGATALTIGSLHSCALTRGGGVKCWGDNWYGQLGDGTTYNAYYPVDVIGMPAGASTVVAGGLHTCAVTTLGQASCWGNNYFGQLGIGTAIARTVPVDVLAHSFADVPSPYWAVDFIERLFAAGITAGCGTNPTRYCPDGTVTRAQMAVFLLRGVHGSSYAPPPSGNSTGFGDVLTTHWAGAWIKQLVTEGITAGCGNGNYCPELHATRAQVAVFLLRSKYGPSYVPPAVGNSTGFSDVPATHWAGAWIKQLVTEGITAGCGSRKYCPESPVTRAQMSVFLVRTFNLP